MALRLSPGCRCCTPATGCERLSVDYTPTSQLSRGVWDDTQQWQPDLLLNSGDRFLQHRISDGRYCAWESPGPIQTGPAWNEVEESRYDLVAVVDVIDRVEEWDTFGGGWDSLTFFQREQALENGYLFQDCGFISRNNVLPSTPSNWSVEFSYYYPTRFEASVLDYIFDGDGLAFGLYGAIESAQAYLDGLRARYEAKSLADSPVIDISLDCEGYKRQRQWNVKLFGGQSLLDETWYANANFPLLARSSQPVGGNIVDVIEVGATPVSLFSKLSPQSTPYSALLVVGDGEVYAGTDPSDPSQRLAVEDGDIVIAERLHISIGIDAFRLVKRTDIIFEPIVFGGGMRVYAPPDLPTGRKVAIYCSSVQNVNPEMFGGLAGVGIKFQGAFAIKTRQLDEPTCRVVEPRACPCPGDSEWYPVTITEGLNKNYNAIDALLNTFVKDQPIGVAGEIYLDELMGELQYSMLRSGLCDFTFLKLKAWSRVVYRSFPSTDYYAQVVTFGYEDGRLNLSPVYNRMARINASATVGLYNLVEVRAGGTINYGGIWEFTVPIGDPPPLITFDEIVGNIQSTRNPPFPFIDTPYPCDFYKVMEGRWARPGRGYGTGSAYHYAVGEQVIDIPIDDFTCGDYVVQGTYDIDFIPKWWSPFSDPPNNPVLGMPWTITM